MNGNAGMTAEQVKAQERNELRRAAYLLASFEYRDKKDVKAVKAEVEAMQIRYKKDFDDLHKRFNEEAKIINDKLVAVLRKYVHADLRDV